MMKVGFFLLVFMVRGLFAEENTSESVDSSPETSAIAPQEAPKKQVQASKGTNKELSKLAVELINSGQAPKFEALIQRYFMDEILNIRKDIGDLRSNFSKEILDKNMVTFDRILSVNRGIQDYAINVINYFFYCIAVVVSILTLVGWRSISDIKKNANQFAGNELQKLIRTYEDRLDDIENEIKEKSRFVSKNYEILRKTNEKNAIWLKVHMENDLKLKLEYLDEVLAIDKNDVEAWTYKAFVALQLKEYVWALTLCNTALAIDPEHAHALYQKACVYAQLNEEEKALRFLDEAVRLSSSFKKNAKDDKSFVSLANNEKFIKLIS